MPQEPFALGDATTVAADRRPAVAGAQPTHMRRLTELSQPMLTVDEHRVGHRAVISVVGEVDMSTVAQLRAAIDLAATRAFEIWIDLSGTTFMDSSGVHAVAEARTRQAEANRRLAVICPEGPVLRVLTLTSLDRILEIHPSRSAAHRATAA